MTAPRENHWAHLMVAIGLLVTVFGTLAAAQVEPSLGRLSFIALAVLVLAVAICGVGGWR